MLVISRKVEESFSIGPDIVVSFLKIQGRRVQVGITAPPDMLVRRIDCVPPSSEVKP